MNTENIFVAASRRLVACHGITPDDAWKAIAETRRWQSDEWDRIIRRCRAGDVSKVYIVTVGGDEPIVRQALVYAPAERDNIKHVMDFAGQGPIDADEPTLGYYPVSCFEVGMAVKQAVAVEVGRDRILAEVKAGRL